MKHAIVLAVLFLGCGPSPTEQCDTVVHDLCAKYQECTSTSESLCEQTVGSALPCGRAVDVSPSYDECLSDLDKFQCVLLFPDGGIVLPANCKGVVTIK